MMSARHRRRCHSLSDEEANGNHADPGPEPEPEELDWDSYSTTLEHRLAAVGNSIYTLCNVFCEKGLWLEPKSQIRQLASKHSVSYCKSETLASNDKNKAMFTVQ